VLKEIGGIMKAHPDWKLRVDGHTDGIGNDKANADLSRRRADAVKAALVTRYGIDAARLTTAGYGESAPQDTNDTPEGRARNRRVELRRE
jgi:outer membrane protein OmpA-like peptidoglycan-associated protein